MNTAIVFVPSHLGSRANAGTAFATKFKVKAPSLVEMRRRHGDSNEDTTTNNAVVDRAARSVLRDAEFFSLSRERIGQNRSLVSRRQINIPFMMKGIKSSLR